MNEKCDVAFKGTGVNVFDCVTTMARGKVPDLEDAPLDTLFDSLCSSSLQWIIASAIPVSG